MKKSFEIPVYNEEVRQAVRSKQNHPSFEAKWADSRYIELPAKNVKSVIKKIRSKYPRRRGFKITAITEIPEFTTDKDEF